MPVHICLFTFARSHLPVHICLFIFACSHLPVHICLFTFAYSYLPVHICRSLLLIHICLFTFARSYLSFTFACSYLPFTFGGSHLQFTFAHSHLLIRICPFAFAHSHLPVRICSFIFAHKCLESYIVLSDFWILCDTKIVSGILILLNSLNSFQVSILSEVTMFFYVFVVSNLLTLSKFSNVVWGRNFVSLLNIVCREIYSGISTHRNYNLSNILMLYYILVLSIVLALSNFANVCLTTRSLKSQFCNMS